MPAGYSGTPLTKKLGIKLGHCVVLLNAPEGFESLLTGLADAAVFTGTLPRAEHAADVIVCFVMNRAELKKRLPGAKRALAWNGGLWFAWPKRASKIETDVTEDVVREESLATGLVDNKVCAIDETWSGLRIVHRVQDRPNPARTGR